MYVAGRSNDKAEKAISKIKAEYPNSKGRLEFLLLDLADLSTIRHAAESFMARESRLDVLTNNAGVMSTTPTWQTAQGYELQLGTNAIGPFVFTKHLLPILKKTAAIAPPGSVRVTWAGSLTVDVYSPKGGVQFDEKTGSPVLHKLSPVNYGQSKAANVFLATEFAKRYGGDGIVSVVCQYSYI